MVVFVQTAAIALQIFALATIVAVPKGNRRDAWIATQMAPVKYATLNIIKHLTNVTNVPMGNGHHHPPVLKVVYKEINCQLQPFYLR